VACHAVGLCVDELGDAEVEHLDELFAAALADDDVGGLQVTVHDAGGMRFLERVARLDEEADDAVGAQGELFGDDLAEVAAVEILHGDVGRAVEALAEVDDVDRVRVPQLAGGERLLTEALVGVSFSQQALAQDLERHGLLERHLGGPVDDAHASHADGFFDAECVVDHLADVGVVTGRRHVLRLENRGPAVAAEVRRDLDLASTLVTDALG